MNKEKKLNECIAILNKTSRDVLGALSTAPKWVQDMPEFSIEFKTISSEICLLIISVKDEAKRRDDHDWAGKMVDKYGTGGRRLEPCEHENINPTGAYEICRLCGKKFR